MMKRLLIALMLPLVGLLSACATPMTPEQREALVIEAIAVIESLEAQGINYVEADPALQNKILTVCAIAPIALAMSTTPERAGEIRDTCHVIQRAVQ